jgi:hypothetical protein
MTFSQFFLKLVSVIFTKKKPELLHSGFLPFANKTNFIGFINPVHRFYRSYPFDGLISQN